MERALIEPLEDRLRQFGEKLGGHDHREVHEETHRRRGDDRFFKPLPHRRTVDRVEDVSESAADQAQHWPPFKLRSVSQGLRTAPLILSSAWE